ncbi:MAG: sigma 54-interacting transcriptional regulator [Syntrophobacteraceae bacterium]
MPEHDFERYWKEIVNTMNDGLLIVSPEGLIRMANDAMEQMTGFSREEMIGKPCSIFHCDGCEAARAGAKSKWCLLFDLDRPNMKRCIITRKDGSYISVYKRASLLKNGSGEVLGAVETLTDLSELDRKEREIHQLWRILDTDSGFQGMIGRSAVMEKIFLVIEKAAQSDAPVLIYGPSGTGKELAARAMHELGRRREGPYIELNCAALNESLLESELFGHVKGAFTGAYRHRQGRFEAAHGGDIFLDEIGDIPMPIQVKLLRVLETKQFERVGDHRPICADVRIIAATNRDLDDLVAEKKFREDLFFRINVIPIHLPALRERMEDVPLLVGHFVRGLRERTGKQISGLSPEAMKIFMSHNWPGNVRELRSALEYAFVIAEIGLIEPVHLPQTLTGGTARVCFPVNAAHDEPEDRARLVEALRQCGGNQSEAAKILGISRVTVWNRMRKYAIDLRRVIGDK